VPETPPDTGERLNGAAIRRIARLENDLRSANRAAETDALTGVANRAALDKALPTAEGDPNTHVVVFDANNFGQVNKLVGQEAGDAMIKQVADAVQKAAAEFGVGGRVFRRGGDEFVVLAPAAVAEKIRARAEELFGQQPIATDAWFVSDHPIVSLSGTSANTFREADATLQAAKATAKAAQQPRAETPLESLQRTGVAEGPNGLRVRVVPTSGPDGEFELELTDKGKRSFEGKFTLEEAQKAGAARLGELVRKTETMRDIVSRYLEANGGVDPDVLASVLQTLTHEAHVRSDTRPSVAVPRDVALQVAREWVANQRAATAPAPSGVTYFRSGIASAPADFDGFAAAHVPIGVTVRDITPAIFDRAVAYVQAGGQVFVDSGALGAFKSNLPPPNFVDVLATYKEIADRVGPEQAGGLFVVAPDVLGNAEETQALQLEHGEALRDLMVRGVHVIVPIQKSETSSLAEQMRWVDLNVRPTGPDRPIVFGIPFNKVAYSTADVAEALPALDALREYHEPVAIHLLGIVWSWRADHYAGAGDTGEPAGRPGDARAAEWLENSPILERQYQQSPQTEATSKTLVRLRVHQAFAEELQLRAQGWTVEQAQEVTRPPMWTPPTWPLTPDVAAAEARGEAPRRIRHRRRRSPDRRRVGRQTRRQPRCDPAPEGAGARTAAWRPTPSRPCSRATSDGGIPTQATSSS
jgi:diguanylate cyclase (GGDEF)-like protein